MKIEQTKLATLVSIDGQNIDDFISEIDLSLKGNHLIVNILGCDVEEAHIQSLAQSALLWNDAGYSFVVMSNRLSYDSVPDSLMLVPTLQEAFDMIEMENIQRDLGF